MTEELEISPVELQARMDRGDSVAIVDVREPGEYAMTRLEGSELVPMGTVPANLQKLEAMADERPLAILCHHGVRSLQVTVWLRSRGVQNCFSVAGGIDRWSREVDSGVPRY